MTRAALFPEDVRGHLATRAVGRRLFYYPETDSTNDAAIALARGGEPEGTVVYADFQRRGRGRLDHVWTSPRGRDLLFSVIMRPSGEPRDVLALTLVVALSAAVVLGKETGADVGVEWPNDLVVGAAKIGGILAESGSGEGGRYVVVGVGVNVNGTRDEFPDDVGSRAVSCRVLTGIEHDRAALLGDLLSSLETYAGRFTADGFAPLLSAYEARLSMRGARVRVRRGESVWEGIVDGVAADGALCVRRDNGAVESLYGETVEVIA